jgi:hypothetical protein
VSAIGENALIDNPITDSNQKFTKYFYISLYNYNQSGKNDKGIPLAVYFIAYPPDYLHHSCGWLFNSGMEML